MSVNQFITFFFYQSLQAAVCVISVRVGVDSNNAFSLFSFSQSGCSEREKQEGKERKIEKRRAEWRKKERGCWLTMVRLLFLPRAN